MKVFLFDDTPAKPGERHGSEGPCHCGTANLDYEYQLEELVRATEEDHAFVVRITCPSMGREWKRVDGVFVDARMDA